MVVITVEVSGVATHPEDDLVLAAAVSAGADYLVTGDKQLLKLGRYQGATILSPRDFAEVARHPESVHPRQHDVEHDHLESG